jgi:hypothetical protein
VREHPLAKVWIHVGHCTRRLAPSPQCSEVQRTQCLQPIATGRLLPRSLQRPTASEGGNQRRRLLPNSAPRGNGPTTTTSLQLPGVRPLATVNGSPASVHGDSAHAGRRKVFGAVSPMEQHVSIRRYGLAADARTAIAS